jgi:hypothetical protein
MAKLSRDFAAALGALATLHPREDIIGIGVLGSVSSEVIIAADGCNSVAVDLRGTFNQTIEVAGSIDGVNWQLIPVQPVNQTSKSFVAAIVGTAAGTWAGKCGIYRFVRARCTAWTSGGAAAVVLATNGALDDALDRKLSSSIVTNTGAAGAAVTLTLPAPGSGLRQFLTYLSLNRVNGTAAALTAAAGPLNVTTTNVPGTLVISMANDALPAGGKEPWREDFAFPIPASANNTAITFVAPASTGVIWRLTAGYYNAP